jgi:predicted outer membrane protein
MSPQARNGRAAVEVAGLRDFPGCSRDSGLHHVNVSLRAEQYRYNRQPRTAGLDVRVSNVLRILMTRGHARCTPRAAGGSFDMTRFTKVAGFLLVTVTLTACGQSSPTGPSPLSGLNGPRNQFQESPTLSTADRAFVDAAAMIYSAHQQLGALANKRGDVQEVKEFGELMMQDQTRSLVSLREIARSHVNQTITLSPTQQLLLTDLSARGGSDFDRRFMAGIIAELEANLAVFQSQGVNAGYAPLRSHAMAMVERLTLYLRMAREIQQRVE